MTSRWTKITAIAVIVVLLGYGGYRYVVLAKNNRTLRVTVLKLEDTVAQLQGNLSLTEYERDKLTTVLQETTEKAGTLEEQTQELNGKVSDFEKLNSLDPELLKKYSKVYFLNEHYVPSSLTDIDPVFINGKGRVIQAHADVWPHLKKMLEDSTEQGLGLLATSGYRSFGTQEALKSSYKVIYGAGTANQFSADQGYSEHQLGTTFDFTTIKTKNLSSAFDKTPEFKWLNDHAYEYGFTLSYPKGNKYYIYEPWHWRFVGIQLARKLHDDGKHLYDMDQRDIDTFLLNIFD